MGLQCGDVYSRLLGRSNDGAYIDVQWQCLKASCERCWIILWNRKIWATRIAMQKLGIINVHIGLLNAEDRRTARHWKDRHKDKPNVLSMLTTYHLSNNAGMFATYNMIPSRDVLIQMPLEEALSTYYRWGDAYRPKRVTSDWELKLPSTFQGKFAASASFLTEWWQAMSEDYGYKPGDTPDDPVAFERRGFLVRERLMNPNRNTDTDMYS